MKKILTCAMHQKSYIQHKTQVYFCSTFSYILQHIQHKAFLGASTSMSMKLLAALSPAKPKLSL